MARLTRAEALRYADHALRQFAVAFLSGKNPDDTDFTLPVGLSTTDAANLQTIADAAESGDPVEVTPDISRGAGTVDANTQRVVLASDGPTVTALGAPADAAYSSGSGSIVSILKGLFAKFVLDSTDRVRVSLYGKSSAAGDTALTLRADGKPQVFLEGAAGVVGSVGSSDAKAGTIYLATEAANDLYNGSTWDRQRGNSSSTLLASAARTTTQNATFTNHNGRGCIAHVDVTAFTSGGLTPTIQVQDSVSGVWVDVLTGAKIVATGHVALEVFPGIAAVANLAASKTLGRACRLRLVPDDATSITYSASVDVLV